MASDGTASTKICEETPLPNDSVKRPKNTTLSVKNLRNAINFSSEEKSPCNSTWYRDLKATHVRNRTLLDLPFPLPKCCADIYNISLDRQKLKRLKKFNLKRPVRTVNSCLEEEEVERYIPKQVTKGVEVTVFPECFILPDSSSEDEISDVESAYELCKSGSVSLCSECSTLGNTVTKRRTKVHKKKLECIQSTLQRQWPVCNRRNIFLLNRKKIS